MIDERKNGLKLIKETCISEFHYNLINEEFQRSLYNNNIKNNNICIVHDIPSKKWNILFL